MTDHWKTELALTRVFCSENGSGLTPAFSPIYDDAPAPAASGDINGEASGTGAAEQAGRGASCSSAAPETVAAAGDRQGPAVAPTQPEARTTTGGEWSRDQGFLFRLRLVIDKGTHANDEARNDHRLRDAAEGRRCTQAIVGEREEAAVGGHLRRKRHVRAGRQ